MPNLDRSQFVRLAAQTGSPEGGAVAIPIGVRLLADQLTPVLAYRRLVAPDERTAPSFLLESVENGDRLGRHSILGSRPVVEVVARGNDVEIRDRRNGAETTETARMDDPADALRAITGDIRLVTPTESLDRGWLPDCIWGGWFGYAAYDTVRYGEPGKLASPPPDDRGLPDLHFGLYDGVIVFDHIDRLVHVVQLAVVNEGDDAGAVYDAALEKLSARAAEIQTHSKPLPAGMVPSGAAPVTPMASNITRAQHAEMLAAAKEYIAAGDIFQVVLGQRFEKKSAADPFDVYRALRAVNPSPYMVYMQAGPCILVASSPEILCRVERVAGIADEKAGGEGPERFMVTNRPLAGTRRRGKTPAEDLALERELLADEKERAEHIMLVDLGRNDVGRVAEAGSIELSSVMSVERYSHVMHISSTVTGVLRGGLDCWDALRAALPVGTISGAPKIRAMQIIDELEPVRRGPYGGGMGAIGLDGQMDIALALRTIVVPVDLHDGETWTYHVQAAGGIVADSDADDEFMETVNKAAALGRAIELAERAFG